MTAQIVHLRLENRSRTKTGQPGQDIQDIKAGTGHPGQDNQDRSLFTVQWTDQGGQVVYSKEKTAGKVNGT